MTIGELNVIAIFLFRGEKNNVCSSYVASYVEKENNRVSYFLFQGDSVSMGNCLTGHAADDLSLLHEESDHVSDRLGPPPPYQVKNDNKDCT